MAVVKRLNSKILESILAVQIEMPGSKNILQKKKCIKDDLLFKALKGGGTQALIL